MDEDQWICDNILSEEVNVNEDNGEERDVFENIDCSDAFNTYHMFATRDDVLHRACFVAYDICFVAVIMRSHNHALAKSFIGHPYANRLTKDEKILIGDMTKSMVKLKNILLTLKEHNATSCTTMKQVYNARYTYRSSIRGNSTNKTNRYRLSLLDIVGVTPIEMTFSIAFAYLEGERINNVVWALEWFRVKIVCPEATNLLYWFHIDKNVKAKCTAHVGKKNA
ncbi:hypothetical protein GmHk_16G046513 [Glycine max]|nr:hypothetical protein GmHk_16G046513 [Glycine max]